jgi:hypothetical protein
MLITSNTSDIIINHQKSNEELGWGSLSTFKGKMSLINDAGNLTGFFSMKEM